MAITLAHMASGPVVPALSVSPRILKAHLEGAIQPCPPGSCSLPGIGIGIVLSRDTPGLSVRPSFSGQQISLPRGGQSLIKILFPFLLFIQQIFIEHPLYVRPVLCTRDITVSKAQSCPQDTHLLVNRATGGICSSKCCKNRPGQEQRGCCSRKCARPRNLLTSENPLNSQDFKPLMPVS